MRACDFLFAFESSIAALFRLRIFTEKYFYWFLLKINYVDWHKVIQSNCHRQVQQFIHEIKSVRDDILHSFFAMTHENRFSNAQTMRQQSEWDDGGKEKPNMNYIVKM